MKQKKKKICIFLLLIMLGGISLPIMLVSGSSLIPDEYSQDLTLNQSYVYNITKFDSVLYWYGLDWTHKGDFITNPGGQITINITGFFTKHVNDDSPFTDPAPYINLTFLENIGGILVNNGTLINITNAESALTLVLGFNYFKSGFFIPTNDINKLKEDAYFNAKPGTSMYDVNGTVKITEDYDSITIDFKADNGSQNNTLTYSTNTGVLLFAKIESAYGPDIEMFLLSEELEKIPSYPIFILLGIISMISIISIVLKKKDIKIKNNKLN